MLQVQISQGKGIEQRSAWTHTQSMWLLCPAFSAAMRSVSWWAHSQCSFRCCKSIPVFSFPFSHSFLPFTYPQITNPCTNARSFWVCCMHTVICVMDKASILEVFFSFKSTGPRNLFPKLTGIQEVRVLRMAPIPVKAELRTSSLQC